VFSPTVVVNAVMSEAIELSAVVLAEVSATIAEVFVPTVAVRLVILAANEPSAFALAVDSV
jgi:hypothetical protein